MDLLTEFGKFEPFSKSVRTSWDHNTYAKILARSSLPLSDGTDLSIVSKTRYAELTLEEFKSLGILRLREEMQRLCMADYDT